MRPPVIACRWMIVGILLFITLCPTSTLALAQPHVAEPTDTGADAPPATADLVVIIKSDRVLYLYADGLVIGQYPIALGKNPIGTKHKRGDNKTPEGGYTLDWRNPNSIFHRSIHVSYPDSGDIAASQALGRDPGDMIMIHGQPDYDNRERKGDWTNGCIAVSNAAIDDIWARVSDGTRVHIYP